MRYAEALSGASLLPESYRGKPANLLLALEYGAALDLAPMVAVQEIHVIKGKPTLSALLQAALVRKAGHRLRVTGDSTTATCEITRADDPDFTFTSTWTLDRAKAAGLLSNDSWRKYPDNMLKARAISECTRNACSDVIAGFGYTAEELGGDAVESFPQTDSGATVAGPPASEQTHSAVAPESPGIEDAEVIEPSALTRPVERLTTTPADDPWATDSVGEAAAEGVSPTAPRVYDSGPKLRNPGGKPSEKARGMMFALLRGDDGKARPREENLAIIAGILGRDVASSDELDAADVSAVIDALKAAAA